MQKSNMKKSNMKKSSTQKQKSPYINIILCLFMVTACEIREPTYEETTSKKQLDLEGRTGTKLGGGIGSFSKQKQRVNRDSTNLANFGSGDLQVNRYLWTASLDIMSFLPFTQADAVAGVILTDWHALNEDPTQRYKVNLIITGTQLRPDALRVVLFKQKKQGDNWQDVTVSKDSVNQLEESILTRAREIRYTSLGFK